MQKEDAIKKINETVKLLYQNKEKQAMERVAELLPFFHSMADRLVASETNNALVIINMLKELVENYENFDMIGMADCLQDKAFDLIQKYSTE